MYSSQTHFEFNAYQVMLDCKMIWRISYCIFRFAMELNEILESERKHLPKTDTRFRPDQRALEVRKNSLYPITFFCEIELSLRVLNFNPKKIKMWSDFHGQMTCFPLGKIYLSSPHNWIFIQNQNTSFFHILFAFTKHSLVHVTSLDILNYFPCSKVKALYTIC